MLISNIFNDSFGLLSKQLRFYCWHFKRNLDQRQRENLIELLQRQHFQPLAEKIRSLNQSPLADCKQQVSKLLFEKCLQPGRRHQLIQLIESRLVDIDVRLDNYGRTLLHRCAYNLDVDLVKLLIEKSVNIRLRDYAGNTALHIAIQSYRNGNIIYGNEQEVVKNLRSIVILLLDADKNQRIEESKRKRVKLDDPEKPDGSIQSKINLIQSGKPVKTKSISVKNAYPASNQNPRMKSDIDLCKMKSNLETGKFQQNMSNDRHDDNSNGRCNEMINHPDDLTGSINPLLLEDNLSPLVDTKNAFGRTPLHYCVIILGEKHLAQFIDLLIYYGVDLDITDTRMKTPLYCLVKRPAMLAIRQKCHAVKRFLETGCDDLGLAIDPKTFFTDELVESLDSNSDVIMQSKSLGCIDPIFVSKPFKRVPSLKHIARLRLIILHDRKNKTRRQSKVALPENAPSPLTNYVNRKILDQSEFF